MPLSILLLFSLLLSSYKFELFTPTNVRLLSTQADVSLTAQTNSFKRYYDFGHCSCDLTSNTCDYNCCCDSDCSAAIVAQWQATPSVSCIDYCNVKIRIDPVRTASIPCNSSAQIVEYNRKYGLTEYISPLNSLFCVYRHSMPLVRNYYDNITSIDSSTSLNILSSATGFAASIFQNTGSITNTYYAINSTLRAKYSNSQNIIGIFAVPRPNMSGQCNDFAEAAFMQNIENQFCARVGSITQLCEAGLELDGDTYTSSTHISLLAGESGTSGTLNVGSITYYSYNNGQYSGSSAMIATSSGSICQNYAREIHYTITVVEQANAGTYGFGITAISAAVVYSNFDFASTSNIASVPQVFSLKFTESPSTSWEKSGNPGYLSGRPLLIGKQVSSTEPISHYTTGYHMRGATIAGACYENASNLGPFGPRVDYNSKISFSCYKDLTAAQLQSQCTSTFQDNLVIFKQASQMGFIGKFGSSSGLHGADWISMTPNSVNPPSYDPTTKQCTQRVGMQLNILTSTVGFPTNSHQYIVDASLSEIESQVTMNPRVWEYVRNDGQAQRFYYYFEVNFKDYDDALEELEASSSNVSSASSSTGDFFSWKKVFAPFYVNRD